MPPSCSAMKSIRCILTRNLNSTLSHQHSPPLFCKGSSPLQSRRCFFGFSGKDIAVLSKTYEEKRVLGYSPEQLFNLVSDVEYYHEFVPWCQRSNIVRHYPNGSFDAKLEIGFKFFVESYISHVELNRTNSIKSTVSDSILFHHLINIWTFYPGSVAGTCDLHFFVDFKFRSPFYTQVASLFFKEVVTRLVDSFIGRCRVAYGPGVRVFEGSYGQST